MKKSKKTLIIVLVIVLVVLSIVAVGLFLFNKKQEKIQKQEEETIINAEENFKKLFLNLEYTENKNEAITLSYQFEKTEEGKYEVDINSPLFNIDSEVARTINKEIDDVFGQKLINVVKHNSVYTKYSVDYIAYTNDKIMSLIIKATLKEGANPQRVMVQTYNYDLAENKVISLEEYLELKDIDKSMVQSQIINYIRKKNINSEDLSNQGYNVYVRDVRSDEYLIENIKTYYIGEDGKLYIVFAYGNNNYTETVDIIIVGNDALVVP